MGLASSVFVAGRENRLAFGVIDQNAGFLYGPTAIYLARTPDSPAKGPYPAPADVLVTEPFRSRQAATEEDPFAAVYGARVPLRKPGDYSVMAVSLVDGRPSRRPPRSPPWRRARPHPGGRRARAARGDGHGGVGARRPRLDRHARAAQRVLHEKSLAEVLGKEPVALLFATPQLCASRVCGPVVDEALQLEARYGDRMTFIHQEVYVDNDPSKGCASRCAASGCRRSRGCS